MPKHEIEPVFDQDSKVLIVGSFPSPKSREQGFYYAHPQNRMWKVLSRVFCEPFPETAGERKEFLLRNHIAMWDVLESCEIDGASDTSIRNAVPNDFDRILKASKVRTVFTAGAKAAAMYEKFNKDRDDIRHIALPSTSPANAAQSEDELAASYVLVKLFTLQDPKYRDFIAKLIPNVEKDRIIGIRTPDMRSLCKILVKDTGLVDAFLKRLPHYFYEENGLHSFFIERIKDYDRCLLELDRFLPFVDNWATCDSMKPAVFAKHLPQLREKIDEWLASEDIYTIRFAIELLMNLYLDDAFDPADLKQVARITPKGQPEEARDYYIRMMVAWYFATALAKKWDQTIPAIEKKALSSWVHKKAIQKARESYRITDEQKDYLKTLCR